MSRTVTELSIYTHTNNISCAVRAIAKDPRHTCIILTLNFGCLHVHDFAIKYSAVYDSYVYTNLLSLHSVHVFRK